MRGGDPGVERPPTVLEQAPVGDLVGERVLERVLEIREEARLVEELGRLEMRRAPAKLVLGLVRDSLEERERHVLPDDGGGLEEALVVGRESIDARGEDRLRRRRDLPAASGVFASR